MTDRELLQEYIRTGDQAAFGQIVDRHTPMIYGVCSRILNDAHTAEDAVQAVFLVFVKQAQRLPPETVLSGWLYRVAQRTALDMRKMNSRRSNRERAVSRVAPLKNTEPQSDLKQELDAVLNTLPDEQRDAIVLRYLQGHDEVTAAKEQNCPVKTLHTRVTRGLGTLREALARRGIKVSSALLLAFMCERTVEAAPAHLAESIKAVATGSATASTAASNAADSVSKTLSAAPANAGMLTVAGLVLLTVPAALTYLHFSANSAPPAQAPAASALPAPESPAPVVTPAAAAPQVAENGERFDNPQRWMQFGEVPVVIDGNKLRFEIDNPDKTNWKIGGLLLTDLWRPGDHVTVKFEGHSAIDPHHFFLEVCGVPKESQNPAIALKMACDQFTKRRGTYDPKPFDPQQWRAMEFRFTPTMDQYICVRAGARGTTKPYRFEVRNFRIIIQRAGTVRPEPAAKPSISDN